MKMKPGWLLAGALVALPVPAQQFQQVGSGLPGPLVWSEGVETFDANGDGWLDLLFANGIGFSSAGGALAPTLLINHTTIGGTITFADETATRVPAGFVQQGKALVPCDVDGDGDMDVVFANAFQNQPRILINDGSGHFSDETATRFPVMLLNSFGLGCGDVDDDGDLDLVLADAGANPFSAPGGKVRLLINDGSGHFTDSPGSINAANKIGAQNAQLLDIDNDFDLDLVVDGKSGGQQLYLNDGNGNFTLQPTGTIPNGSGNTYATDWADLDNDGDLDGFYISIQALNEGTAQNNSVAGGALNFTGTTATIGGLNGDDDNDIVFLDTDNDGRLDVIVGSLAGAREKLYLNNGTFGAGGFAYQSTGFTTLTDSTLDLCVGDFDRDGRYDIATAQGESGGFTNRVYRNTGPIDSVAPRIGRVEPTPLRVPLRTFENGGLVRRAWIQDATFKRRQTFVGARLDGTAVKGASSQPFSVPMNHVGGGIHRGVLQPPTSPTGRVGMDVTFSVHATDPGANASDSAPATFRICGAESYGTLVPNSSGQSAQIAGVQDPSLANNNFAVRISGLPASANGVLLYGASRLNPPEPSGAGVRVVAGTARGLGHFTADATGVALLPLDFTQLPLSALHPGETRLVQFEFGDPAAGTWNASNGLEIVLCD